MVKNIVKHFSLVMRHKWVVFKLCTKLGMPIRGLCHDLSKFTPTEFFESAKYYDGSKSPIKVCKQVNGYSKAWLHHKGRNKHHPEYWLDLSAPDKTPIMPYKYVAEMICDKLSASKTYNGKNFTNSSELEYWKVEREKIRINEYVKDMLTDIFTQISVNGINKVITRKNLKEAYKKYCIDGARIKEE